MKKIKIVGTNKSGIRALFKQIKRIQGKKVEMTEKNESKYLLDDLIAVDDSDDDNEDKNMHAEMDGINMNGDHYAGANSRL